MKKLLAALAMFGALSGAQAAPIVVSFVPAATQIAVGESTTVEMRITGLDDEVLSSFDIDMFFDAAVLDNFFVTWTGFAEMGGPDAEWDVTFGPDVTEVLAYSLLDDPDLAAIQSNSFVVLTFGFEGLADGASLINLGADIDFERNFVGLDGATLDVTVNGTCIAVGDGDCNQRVPEPAGLALFGVAACSGLWAARRRSRPLASLA
jgi:hypothetical protein